jgi:hypothetical protein
MKLEAQVGNILAKLPEARTNGEVEQVFVWFVKKQTKFFNSLSNDSTLRKAALVDICRNATRQICQPEEVVIRQGDLGDSFYVILNGTCDVSNAHVLLWCGKMCVLYPPPPFPPSPSLH